MFVGHPPARCKLLQENEVGYAGNEPRDKLKEIHLVNHEEACRMMPSNALEKISNHGRSLGVGIGLSQEFYSASLTGSRKNFTLANAYLCR